VLAREYQSPVLMRRSHRLTVDTWAVQHPDHHPPKSLATHLLALCLALEHDYPFPAIASVMNRFVESNEQFPAFDPPPHRGRLTVLDVRDASDEQEHADRVRRWAEEVWDAWARHDDRVLALGGYLEGASR
jgi:hypothetical protein